MKTDAQKAAALLGRLGGLKGGRAKSPAKTAAARRNILKRWSTKAKNENITSAT